MPLAEPLETMTTDVRVDNCTIVLYGALHKGAARVFATCILILITSYGSGTKIDVVYVPAILVGDIWDGDSANIFRRRPFGAHFPHSNNDEVFSVARNRFVKVDFQPELGIDGDRLVEFEQGKVILIAADLGLTVIWIGDPDFAIAILCAIGKGISLSEVTIRTDAHLLLDRGIVAVRRKENNIRGNHCTATSCKLD